MTKLSRSYFFEFSGMPKAGKTTVIECVRHFFRRNDYHVRNFNGHDRNIGIDKSYARELNLVLAARAVEYVSTYSISDTIPTIHFLDRGLFDRTVFTEMLRKNEGISHDEADVLTQFLLLEQNRENIDGLFVFTVDPMKSLEREYSKTLIESPGRVMNDKYLLEYRETLIECYNTHKDGFKFSSLISTDTDLQKVTSELIARQIWKTIGGDINEFPIL